MEPIEVAILTYITLFIVSVIIAGIVDLIRKVMRWLTS